MTDADKLSRELNELISLIRKLRSPEGCPWDRKQTSGDIGKYLLEEAYEVIESLEENDFQALREELGDLLFQILFLAEIGSELNKFSLIDVLTAIREKMIRRHPHVFGGANYNTVEQVKENWQQIKKQEKNQINTRKNPFEDIPRSLPALKRAQRITAVASIHGFDWENAKEAMNKLKEEISEFNQVLQGEGQHKMEEELGDVFFTLVNISRLLKIDAENALTLTTNKFLRRFNYIDNQLNFIGKSLEETSLEEMDKLWEEAKKSGI